MSFKLRNRLFILVGILCCALLTTVIYFKNTPDKDVSTFIEDKSLSLDERTEILLNHMTTAEKVGQMMIIGVQDTKINDDSLYMLHEYHIGGIILFDRNMENKQQVLQFTQKLQQNAQQKLPLFIGIDEEGGKVARMQSELTPPPSALEIGESKNYQQAQVWAEKISNELKAMGINLNFAPVADVGSDDDRSYSTDPNEVANFVLSSAKGYENSNMLYSLKHFPGIGKGKVDTHINSYSVQASKESLYAEDILPFKSGIEKLSPDKYFIMVSHITYPAFDEHMPASLSPKIITGILRQELGYKGIVITDDLEMGAISNHYSFDEVGVKAIQAGADMVLVCHEYEHEIAVYNGILKAVQNGEISDERLNESVRRIIRAKILNLY